MEMVKEIFRSSIIFWAAWTIIPLLMEVIPTFFNFLILLKRKIQNKKSTKSTFMPEISLIVPVYNSADTLYECIKSIHDSDYPKDAINILLVNNKSTDNSFEIFCKCQAEFTDLTIQWVNAKQGKSKALNLALFNASGKYIIHIDSDGLLQSDALRNMVDKFEREPDTQSMTGTILTNPIVIDETKEFFLRLVRKIEFFEYAQAFLAGRNYQSEFNSIFTLSGAFSSFRKSSILKTQLYNTETVCEDTHVTFQIRENRKEKISLCHNAIFFVDPIENINQLYVQRQRWQRGEIEVMHMFTKKRLKVRKGLTQDFVVRLSMFDHTFAFPRMIWYFALICLGFVHYPFSLIIKTTIAMYLLYVIATFFLYISIILFLQDFTDLKKYYRRKWYVVFLLPIYNFVVFWFRFAGIINSIKGSRSWSVRNLTDEKKVATDIISKDFSFVQEWLNKLRSEFNEPEDIEESKHEEITETQS